MPGNFKFTDERVRRTNDALMEAMSRLLEQYSFNKITINDICEEAQIGRTTFYSRYRDKYDFLSHWLRTTVPEDTPAGAPDLNIEKRISAFININEKRIRHLIDGANDETLGLLCDFLLSLMEIDKPDNSRQCPKHNALSRVCCGGILYYLDWQSKNRAMSDIKVADSYFFIILNTLSKWNREHI